MSQRVVGIPDTLLIKDTPGPAHLVIKLFELLSVFYLMLLGFELKVGGFINSTGQFYSLLKVYSEARYRQKERGCCSCSRDGRKTGMVITTC